MVMYYEREKFYLVILFLTYCSSSSWVQRLVIPTRFSKSCMNSIKMGILTGHARDEIINSLATCILLFKLNPSPDEKRLICERLIKTIPSLKDTLGSGYVRINFTILIINFFNRILGIRN